jgi:hypothetical protein
MTLNGSRPAAYRTNKLVCVCGLKAFRSKKEAEKILTKKLLKKSKRFKVDTCNHPGNTGIWHIISTKEIQENPTPGHTCD